MSTARLTCLVAAAAVAAAGLVPAAAAPAVPPAPGFVDLDPARALRSATHELLTEPSEQAWRATMLAGVGAVQSSQESPTGSAEPPREFAAAYSAGDVDGDRREDVVVLREDGTVVRSGRDGRALLRRKGGFLLPVQGAGAVRLVALESDFAEQSRGFEVTVRYTGLDGRGRAVWTHEATGSLTADGAGPAFVVTYQRLPLLLGEHQDAAGRPALLLGGATGMSGDAAGAAEMSLEALSLQDGSVAALPPLHGVGGLPWASPLDPELVPGCYAATEPVGPTTTVSLRCADGAPRWVRPVPLEDAFAGDAGRFDGDDQGDVLVSTFGFEPTQAQDVLRGTRVLSGADGSQLGASTHEALVPLRGDVNGDGEPDFLELVFDDEGFVIQGVTLSGTVLYRRSIALRGAGFLEGFLGLDVTGDGIGDAFLRAEPDRGTPVAVVLDGRSGRPLSVPGVDALVAPGLRPRGADLLVLDAVGRRPTATVRSGDRGRPLMAAPLPVRSGPVAAGGTAVTGQLDGDRRRDLVVVGRVGSTRLTTAYSATGRVLWHIAEKAPGAGEGVIVVVEAG